ncbi:MAG: hypothetical protein QXL14_03110 [Candidatus Aenigmatarchaeota archaeon]
MISREALTRLENDLRSKGIAEPLIEKSKKFAENIHFRLSNFFFSEVPEDKRHIYAKLLEDNCILMARNWALGLSGKLTYKDVSNFLEK